MSEKAFQTSFQTKEGPELKSAELDGRQALTGSAKAKIGRHYGRIFAKLLNRRRLALLRSGPAIKA
jgi:hypothetical protein